jgi:hypothetical protein
VPVESYRAPRFRSKPSCIQKPRIIFAAGEQDKKKKILSELIDTECIELDNFKIEFNERKYNLNELPKTYIHRAKDYDGYFIFIYHPNYISYGLGKERYPIAKAGQLEIYRQIVKQILE